jgi:TIR domain-containing protein
MADLSTLRLYLAAVPGNMDGERAVIEGLVLPELRARAEGMGFAIELVDPTKVKGDEWDLTRRFREIDACRPFFLGLVGERYGDPPLAVPLGFVATHPWLAEDPGRSVLELEILHAALRDPANAPGSFFYLRDPRFLSKVPDQQRARFLPENERAAARLADLKERIRASGRPVFDGYPCDWSGGLGRASRLDGLAERILEDLWPAIQAHVQRPAEPRPPEVPTAHVPPEKPLVVHENVQFTVYRPKAVEPMKWYPLLAFAHLAELPEDAPADEPDPLEEVKEQARRVLGGLVDKYADVKQDSRYAVPHEAEITFLPEIPGFEINPPRRTFLWLESVQREEFRIRAGADLDGVLVRGRVSVFRGSILLAEINLGIRVDSRLAGATVSPAERSASRPFRNIFPSYSHRDTGIVEEFERYARTLGDRYLRDVHELRAGEVWNDRLKDLIQQADVFQLFWSQNAMRSPYVEQEWRYAVSLGRPHFVRPTYWEDPLPELPDRGLPPEDLRRLHFQLLPAGAAPTATPHSLSTPPPESRSRGFDPNATVIAPAEDFAAVEEFSLETEEEPTLGAQDLASFYEPPPPEEDESAVGAMPDFAPDLDDTATAVAPPLPPPPPPMPPAAPSTASEPAARPLVSRSSGRGAGLKGAAMLAVAVLGLSIFALRACFGTSDQVDSRPPIASPSDTSQPTEPLSSSGGPTLKGPRSTGRTEPSNQGGPLPPADFETYDQATWRELTAACELSGEEIAGLPSRQEPGASMIEVFASPSAYNARVVKQQLASLGAFVLPRQEEGKAFCAVVLDAWEPAAQEYLQRLRASGTEPRAVLFPQIPR